MDIQTRINGGLHTVLVYTGVTGRDRKYDVELELENLLETVELILLQISTHFSKTDNF